MPEISHCQTEVIHISYCYIRPMAVRSLMIPRFADPMGLLFFAGAKP